MTTRVVMGHVASTMAAGNRTKNNRAAIKAKQRAQAEKLKQFLAEVKDANNK